MAPTSKLFITMGGYFMSAGYAHILGSRWSKNSIGGFVQDLGSFWVDWHKRMIGIFLTNARYCANEDGLEKKSNTKKGYVYYSARLFDQMAAVAEGLGQDIDEK
jgi:hypothetical protein